MASLHEDLAEYKAQLQKGAISKAYKALMDYLMGFRTYLHNQYPEYFVSGSIYYGFMDMSYFSFSPKSIVDRKLKIAIVFLHEAFRFEVWLAGNNKQVQQNYWEMFKDTGWTQYHLVSTTKGADSILEHVLVGDPDFNDLDALTVQIERGTLAFIQDVESFLSQRN